MVLVTSALAISAFRRLWIFFRIFWEKMDFALMVTLNNFQDFNFFFEIFSRKDRKELFANKIIVDQSKTTRFHYGVHTAYVEITLKEYYAKFESPKTTRCHYGCPWCTNENLVQSEF
jgi:hypothetical protein